MQGWGDTRRLLAAAPTTTCHTVRMRSPDPPTRPAHKPTALCLPCRRSPSAAVWLRQVAARANAAERFQELPHALRGEVAWDVNRALLQRLPLFRWAGGSCVGACWSELPPLPYPSTFHRHAASRASSHCTLLTAPLLPHPR